MIEAVQHLPNFVSGFEPERGIISDGGTVEDVPFIARWKKQPEFGRFSIIPADRYETRDTLMAEMKNGKWWVVAFLRPNGGFPRMPVWQPPSKSKPLIPAGRHEVRNFR